MQAEELRVEFSLVPKKNEDKSKEAGRPIFEDVEYVRIPVPGDKYNTPHKPVGEKERERFRAQYEAWKTNPAEKMQGMPLSEWAGITRSEVEELAYFHVRTVEQLAGLSDGNAKNVGPILALRQRAKDFIEKAKEDAPILAMRALLEEEKAQRLALERQLKELVDAEARKNKKQ